jgi:hypothetical protein
MGRNKLAVYTTVYPGVEQFLEHWYRTLCQQSDRRFDLWVGVDGLLLDDVECLIGQDFRVNWVLADSGSTPAQVRQQVINQIVCDYEAVIFVDSDDLLLPTRVAAARCALEHYDVNGCALELIDVDGNDLNIVFGPSDMYMAVSNLPRTNVFGLSNTAYCMEVLKSCLPIPVECVLVDWFLATVAWGMGATFNFDFVPHMRYRQHGKNIAGFLPPFSSQRILKATEMVLIHYDCVLSRSADLLVDRYNEIKEAGERARCFFEAVQNHLVLTQYINALNELEHEAVWWAFVAHPELEWIWKNYL